MKAAVLDGAVSFLRRAAVRCATSPLAFKSSPALGWRCLLLESSGHQPELLCYYKNQVSWQKLKPDVGSEDVSTLKILFGPAQNVC